MTTEFPAQRISNALNFLMMKTRHGNTFRVTGPLWRESTGQRWITLAKASKKGFGVSFDVSPEISGCTKLLDACDLGRHGVHYDGTAICPYNVTKTTAEILRYCAVIRMLTCQIRSMVLFQYKHRLSRYMIPVIRIRQDCETVLS